MENAAQNVNCFCSYFISETKCTAKKNLKSGGKTVYLGPILYSLIELLYINPLWLLIESLQRKGGDKIVLIFTLTQSASAACTSVTYFQNFPKWFRTTLETSGVGVCVLMEIVLSVLRWLLPSLWKGSISNNMVRQRLQINLSNIQSFMVITPRYHSYFDSILECDVSHL